jgi:hypothetical protein
MTARTVEALASRQVNFTVETLPWPGRWGAILAHLRQFHGASTPSGPVVSPRHLTSWHRFQHSEWEDAWIAAGTPTVTPHQHLGRLGRLRQWWEFRS